MPAHPGGTPMPGIPIARPEAIGFDTTRLDRASRLLEKWTTEDRGPAARVWGGRAAREGAQGSPRAARGRVRRAARADGRAALLRQAQTRGRSAGLEARCA